jgi:fructose-1,6-bisphosphatase
MSVPKTGTIYSVNEGNSQYWDAAMTQCAEKETVFMS